MVRRAEELAEQHGWFLARQFENPANPQVHADTTAREIIEDFGPNGLDYFVSGFGTGGTITGVSRTLRADSPSTVFVAAEPDNAQIMASGHVQKFADDGSAAESHPGFRPHPMQGWSPDFISQIANEALEEGRIDKFTAVKGDDAMTSARDLARKEGIFVGISAGATFAAALEVAKSAPKGSRITKMSVAESADRVLLAGRN